MREFKLAKGWAIFIYIVAPLAIILFTILGVSAFIEFYNGVGKNVWSTIFTSLILIVLMAYGLREAIVGRFVIDEDRVYMRSAFNTRSLNHEEIKGFKVDDSYIHIVPKSKKHKTIKVSTYLQGKEDILAWLSEHFVDMDLAELLEDENEIMLNSDFGESEMERAIKLEKTTKLTKFLNWTASAVAIWTFLFADPYELSILVCIAFPLITVFLIRFSKGMIRIDEFNNTIHPSLTGALLMPTFAILIRGLVDFEILDFKQLWMPSLIVTIILFLGIYIGKTGVQLKKARDYYSAVAILIFLFIYSIGTILTLNGHYDSSVPHNYTVKILEKSVSKGKTKSYHFDLEPWGPRKDNNQVTVKFKLYEKKSVQQTVQVHTKKGLFGIPWYYVSE